MIEDAHSILSSYAPALKSFSGYLRTLCGASEQERERERERQVTTAAGTVHSSRYCITELLL